MPQLFLGDLGRDLELDEIRFTIIREGPVDAKRMAVPITVKYYGVRRITGFYGG
jgi:hypothetical protein